MTPTAIVAAAILELMRIGGAADYHASAIVKAATSVHEAAVLTVAEYRESRFSYAIERCHEYHNPGRGAFQLSPDWGNDFVRCGPLPVQARRASDALFAPGCGESALCSFQRYAGRGLHIQEVAERNGIYMATLRRIEEKACVLP